MPGLPIISGIQRKLRESKRQKKLALAADWPKTEAEINHWTVVPVDDDAASFSSGYQVEAGFHFRLNGEYFGGYVRSTAMSHTAAERAANGSPTVTVRYNPANPDETAVLSADNPSPPFEIFSA